MAGTLSITPAPLTITADDQTMVYGAAVPVLTASYSGFVNGDTPASLATPTVLSTAATSASHMGSYVITVGGASDPDYAISFAAGTLAVTPAPLTVTSDDKSKVYGQANPALTAGYSGFVNGDTPASLTTPVTLATAATAASRVGTYAITASGASDPDYAVTFVSGILTVTPAPLTVTAADQTKVYGQPNPALTANYAGFVNGDSAASLSTPVTLATTATAASHVGSYPITPSGASDPDYTITFASGSLSISPAPLTITADDRARVYGQPNPALTVSYADFVNGDSAASLTAAPVVTTTATTGSAAGTYAITASGASDPDYTIAYVAGTLTVSKDTTTTTVSSSANFGQSATLTATVTANAPGSGTPTGSVDFFDLTTSADLGTVSLSGASATLVTAALSPGSHTIPPATAVTEISSRAAEA